MHDSKGLMELRGRYLKGTRIELIHMEDKHAPKKGTKGTVTGVDDMYQIQVQWDTGSTLALVPTIDKFKIIE